MWYFIYGKDSPGSLPARREHRPEHLARLQELKEAGQLFAAGPLPAVDSPDPGEAGFAGSVVIAEFASLDDAKAWAQDDPYIHAGVWASAEVHPYNKVLP